MLKITLLWHPERPSLPHLPTQSTPPPTLLFPNFQSSLYWVIVLISFQSSYRFSRSPTHTTATSATNSRMHSLSRAPCTLQCIALTCTCTLQCIVSHLHHAHYIAQYPLRTRTNGNCHSHNTPIHYSLTYSRTNLISLPYNTLLSGRPKLTWMQSYTNSLKLLHPDSFERHISPSLFPSELTQTLD
jgi:hypothetical protein